MKDKEAPKKRKRQVQKSTPMIAGHTVYISNLSYLRDRQGIRNLFRPYGEVVFIKIIIDLDTLKSKGMAFVEMATAAEAKKAILGLNQQNIDGRTVKAAMSIPMKRQNTATAPVVQKSGEGRAKSVEKRKSKTSLTEFIKQKIKKNIKKSK